MLNGITRMSPNLFATSRVLKIPKGVASPNTMKKNNSNSQNKTSITREFTKLENCTSFEAKQYLEETEYDLDAARAARTEWIESQRANASTALQGFQLSSSPIASGNVEFGKANSLKMNYRNKLEKISDEIYNL